MCPYKFIDHISKLDYVGLPPKEAFYSSLDKEHVSEDDYQHAQTVFNTMLRVLIRDYLLVNLKAYVLRVADVFENLRSKCIWYYKLDPAIYTRIPGLNWHAMLLMTGIELDLITDRDVLDMVEKEKRGGLVFCGDRYSKANNNYLPD